jgi:hypothetical protein
VGRRAAGDERRPPARRAATTGSGIAPARSSTSRTPRSRGGPGGDIVNLVDRRAADARGGIVGLAPQRPDGAIRALARLRMPAHHDVRAEDIDLRRLGKTLAAVADRGPATSPI